MKYFIVAPPAYASGGPELAHQLCYELNKNGCEAYMYYTYTSTSIEDILPVDEEPVEKFKKYNTRHVLSIDDVEQEDSIVVFPEVYIYHLMKLKKCKKVWWWMSVDNYISASDYFSKAFINMTAIELTAYVFGSIDLHLVQSVYAYDWLHKMTNISDDKVLYLSDYIGDKYFNEEDSENIRENIIVYNPKKGLSDLQQVMKELPMYQWNPLENLTEDEMIRTMRRAKLYIDFGNHPGKDRIPRESAINGCCIITNKKGSAAFKEDVPINDDYKFEDVYEQKEDIKSIIHDVMEHYDKHIGRFEGYRTVIRNEKNWFCRDVKQFINQIQNIKWETKND